MQLFEEIKTIISEYFNDLVVINETYVVTIQTNEKTQLLLMSELELLLSDYSWFKDIEIIDDYNDVIKIQKKKYSNYKQLIFPLLKF